MDSALQTSDHTGTVGERLAQDAYGTRERAQRFYDTQMLDHLNPHMREFIARQEMVFVSTADDDGNCDATLRAGPAGFVAVFDDRHLAWPEYRGNGVMASLGNITTNAHVGLLFVDFINDVIGLHVNGAAHIVADEDLRRLHPDLPAETVPGRRAQCWVVVDIDEAYIHCRKHIPQFATVPRQRSWGTDDGRRKGGDYFDVAASRASQPTEPTGAAPTAVEATPEPGTPKPTTPRRRRWWSRSR